MSEEFERRLEQRRAETHKSFISPIKRLDYKQPSRYAPMQRLTDGFSFPIPAYLKSTITQTEECAMRHCNVCGPIHPKRIPEGYLPRTCQCQQETGRARAWQKSEEKRRQEEAKKAIANNTCYQWLGPNFSSEGLEKLTFQNFDAYTPDLQEAVVNMKMFALSPTPVLIITGPLGVGKTHLGNALLHYMRTKKCVPGLFTTAPNLSNYMQRQRELEQPCHDIVAKLSRTPVMFLDDIDKVSATEARITFYTDVFNKRANATKHAPESLLTILTTNIALEDADPLTPYIGAAAADRLNMGLTIISIKGSSYRKRAIIQ
jgi:DNA replication protein DnaC